ncbi:hypothetical protein AgCh_024446 [Apium graveolens]
MDFFKICPVSYALTASPTIYAEIFQEMWSTACISEGEIKLKIKGKPYTITRSVINEALHLAVSNFQNLPTDKDLVSMLNSINLMYNRTIDIGSLLLYKFSYKLGLNEEATEINSAKKKMEASTEKPQTRLSDVDHQLPPGFGRDEAGVPVKLEPDSLEEDTSQDQQELSEGVKRVKTLAAVRDQCKESYSGVDAELRKLDAETEEARVAFEAINDQYNAVKDDFKRRNSQLLQLVGQ